MDIDGKLNGFDLITDFNDIDIFGDATETTVTLSPDQSITLVGVDVASLDHQDFVLI